MVNPKVTEVKVGCARCEGKGYVYVPNGEDDVDCEPCNCVWDSIKEV